NFLQGRKNLSSKALKQVFAGRPRNTPDACCYPGLRCNPKEETYKILITQGERKDGKLSWMYRFVRLSLLAALRSREQECGYETLVFVPENISQNGNLPITLTKGDVLIHIGLQWREAFARLCRRHLMPKEIYCVEYFLEPQSDTGPTAGICEVWTYTHGNLWEHGAWMTPNHTWPRPPLIRFVPPGFLNGHHARVRTYEVSDLQWGYIGLLGKKGWQRRHQCFDHLQEVLPTLERYDAWNLEEWRRFEDLPNLAFINFHKDCNDPRKAVVPVLKPFPLERKSLETVRMAELLSSGYFVVSEEVNPMDAALYDGMVFVEKNLWQPNETWSAQLRELLSNSSQLNAWSAQAFASFKSKFNPQKLLQDAQAGVPPVRGEQGEQGEKADDIPRWFGVCNGIVVILFTLELGISLYAQGCRTFFCGRERWWNFFDLVIILLSLFESVLDFWVESTSSASQGVSASHLRFVRTVRLARALRGIRVMRLLRYVSALRTLVLSIMSSMASLMWTLILLLLLFYSFGVLFTQLVSDECRYQEIARTQQSNSVPRCEEDFGDYYWSSISMSMLTLFMSTTGGVDWEDALDPLMKISLIAVGCLVVYITITFFAIVNVITGVFVTTAMETTAADKDLMVMKQLQRKNVQVDDLKLGFGTRKDDVRATSAQRPRKSLFAEISGSERNVEVSIHQWHGPSGSSSGRMDRWIWEREGCVE
ncbi:Sodium channel protein type 11 subunit alpha (NaN) (Sensory neuron sodium channel 2) (Sodium channel protein type XI subunit alpha) (Voltage-gated sodium channel subunit alpha Nav1.9), partial [Durusdinium trenchii]